MWSNNLSLLALPGFLNSIRELSTTNSVYFNIPASPFQHFRFYYFGILLVFFV